MDVWQLSGIRLDWVNERDLRFYLFLDQLQLWLSFRRDLDNTFRVF